MTNIRKTYDAFFSGSIPINTKRVDKDKFQSILLNAFSEAGILQSDNPNVDLYVSINHDSKQYRKYSRQIKPGGSRILIRFEPKSVFPAQYKPRIEKKYDFVITLGKPEKLHEKFLELNHPYEYMKNPNLGNPLEKELRNLLSMRESNIYDSLNWNDRKFQITLIAANKVSSTDSNNYNLRRKFAKNAKANHISIFGALWEESLSKKIRHRLAVGMHAIKNGTIPNPLSLYGALFSRYENLSGMPEDKHEVIRESKFSLVIENSNTYVSEKLFDAMIGGSIPIYFGPSLVDYGIDEANLVIRYKGPITDLITYLNGLDKSEIAHRLDSIQEFVRSEEFQKKWLAINVYQKLASAVGCFLDAREHQI